MKSAIFKASQNSSNHETSVQSNQLDFTDQWLAKEEDYAIDGQPTEAAVHELLILNKLEELEDLLKNVDDDASS